MRAYDAAAGAAGAEGEELAAVLSNRCLALTKVGQRGRALEDAKRRAGAGGGAPARPRSEGAAEGAGAARAEGARRLA